MRFSPKLRKKVLTTVLVAGASALFVLPMLWMIYPELHRAVDPSLSAWPLLGGLFAVGALAFVMLAMWGGPDS